MKTCGSHNVTKNRDTKNGDKYITLDISLNFGSLYNMKITSSELKDYLGRSGKGLINSLDLKAIIRSKKIKNARFAITNVGLKDISKIIKEFEALPYEGYVRYKFKHTPTGIYLYIARQIEKCMMIFNLRAGPVRMQTTNTKNMNNS